MQNAQNNLAPSFTSTIPTWIIGNWKQNPSSTDEVLTLIYQIKSGLSSIKNNDNSCNKLMVIPSSIHAAIAKQQISDSSIIIGCQDISHNNATTGAFTGDCSAQQMKQVGISWTLIGHSERRQYHNETAEILSTKLANALSQDLGVIYCIGETLAEYDANQTLEVLKSQLSVIKEWYQSMQKTASQGKTVPLIIAYEPVWAIGTGKVPSLAEIENVNQEIRAYLCEINELLQTTPILYGGSVNPDNAKEFAQSASINGALIGGASLVADQFLKIADTFFTVKRQ